MPLYSFYCPIAQVQSGIGIVSLSTTAEQGSQRAGRLMRHAVGIDRHGVPGRAGCNKFLLANPLYGSGLHPAASEEGSLNQVCSHVCTMDSLPLAAAAKLPTGR